MRLLTRTTTATKKIIPRERAPMRTAMSFVSIELDEVRVLLEFINVEFPVVFAEKGIKIS